MERKFCKLFASYSGTYILLSIRIACVATFACLDAYSTLHVLTSGTYILPSIRIACVAAFACFDAYPGLYLHALPNTLRRLLRYYCSLSVQRL